MTTLENRLPPAGSRGKPDPFDALTFWKRLQYRIEFAFWRAFAFIFSRLPTERSADFSAWLWRHVAPRLHRHPRAVNNLKRAFPEKSDAEIETIALDMWDNLGRTFAEGYHLAELVRDGRLVIEDEPRIREIIAASKGVVICAAHMSNWELAASGPLKLGLNMSGVYQIVHNPLVDRDIFEIRQFLYPGGLYVKGPDAARAMMRHATRGGTVGFLADRRDDDGVTVPFFGRPAPSTPFPALIARHFGYTMLAANVIRHPGSRFLFRAGIVDVPVTADKDADVRAGTANLQAEIESWVRLNPAQWTWAHKRWSD